MIILFYVVFMVLTVLLANRYNRSKLGYFVLAIFISPVLTMLVLLVLGKKPEPAPMEYNPKDLNVLLKSQFVSLYEANPSNASFSKLKRIYDKIKSDQEVANDEISTSIELMLIVNSQEK